MRVNNSVAITDYDKPDERIVKLLTGYKPAFTVPVRRVVSCVAYYEIEGISKRYSTDIILFNLKFRDQWRTWLVTPWGNDKGQHWQSLTHPTVIDISASKAIKKLEEQLENTNARYGIAPGYENHTQALIGLMKKLEALNILTP